ncbi:TPA: hypothetical protein VHH39_000946 [Streptococcus pyogenes]|nr:hypothetical protein [Streptococcus pyogenes]
MYSFEYYCENCGKKWSNISAYITLLQSEVEHLKIVTRQNARRLEEHAEQNKTLITMTEQIKNLTDDVKDLKDMMRGEIK